MDEYSVTNRAWASTMPIALTMQELRVVGSSYELEGYEHGDIAASLILVDAPPGSGPRLHRHPYAEIFVIASCRRLDMDDHVSTASDERESFLRRSAVDGAIRSPCTEGRGLSIVSELVKGERM